jgi:hypothetical protein
MKIKCPLYFTQDSKIRKRFKKTIFKWFPHASSLYAIFKNMGDVSLARVSKYKTFKHAIRSKN